MRGSLNRPPIVIRTQRWRAVLHLAAVALLGALMSPLARTDWRANGLAWCLIVLFGILTAASLWELAWPGRLVIGPEGFELRDLWRRRRWSWREARHFRPASNRFYRFVGFDQVKGAGACRDAGDLVQDWELPPQALAALLNEARDRWHAAGR